LWIFLFVFLAACLLIQQSKIGIEALSFFQSVPIEDLLLFVFAILQSKALEENKFNFEKKKD